MRFLVADFAQTSASFWAVDRQTGSYGWPSVISGLPTIRPERTQQTVQAPRSFELALSNKGLAQFPDCGTDRILPRRPRLRPRRLSPDLHQKGAFSCRAKFVGHSGILDFIEDLLEMPERRYEPLPIFSTDGNEGHANP